MLEESAVSTAKAGTYMTATNECLCTELGITIGGIDGMKSSIIQEHVKRGIQQSAHAGMHLRCKFG